MFITKILVPGLTIRLDEPGKWTFSASIDVPVKRCGTRLRAAIARSPHVSGTDSASRPTRHIPARVASRSSGDASRIELRKTAHLDSSPRNACPRERVKAARFAPLPRETAQRSRVPETVTADR